MHYCRVWRTNVGNIVFSITNAELCHKLSLKTNASYRVWRKNIGNIVFGIHAELCYLHEKLKDEASFKLQIFLHDRLEVWMPVRQLSMKNLLAAYLGSNHRLQGRLSPPHPCQNQSSMNMEYSAMRRWVKFFVRAAWFLSGVGQFLHLLLWNSD